MRLAMIADTGGASLAIIKNERAAVLPPLQGSARRDLMAVVTAGQAGLVEVAQAVEALPAAAWRPLSAVQFRLPIERPGKVICLGLNYADHAREGGYQVPEYPALFI